MLADTRFSKRAAAVIVVAVMVASLLLAGCSGSGQPAGGSGEAAANASSANDQETESSKAYNLLLAKKINGWWQSVGQSGMAYHHFVNGIDYIYLRVEDDKSEFSFYTRLELQSTTPFSSGDFTDIDDSGVVFALDNSATYFLMDSDEKSLQCRDADGSNYSGSSSLSRIDSAPSPLAKLAKETEASDKPTTHHWATEDRPEPAKRSDTWG